MRWRRSDGATCIYGLADPRTGELRYIGKTIQRLSGRRVTHVTHAKRLYRDRKSRWAVNWIKALVDLGLKPDIFEIEVIPEGGDWREAEMFWIEYFRALGFNLCNLRAGGEEGNYTKQSPEWIEKKASKIRGRPGRVQSEQEKAFHRANLERYRREGRCHTPIQRAKARATVKAVWKTTPHLTGSLNPNASAIGIGDQKFGSLAEASKAIGVTRRTINNWLHAGKARYL